MFDPDFFSDEQYLQINTVFKSHISQKGHRHLNREQMKEAIRELELIPAPTDIELDQMCTSDHVSVEQFTLVIYWFLRGYGTHDELIEAFKAFDTEKKGRIPYNQLISILSSKIPQLSKKQILLLQKEFCYDNNMVDYIKLVEKIRPKIVVK